MRQWLTKHWQLIVGITLTIVWLVTRFYHLPLTYEFSSDSGRDAWQLWQWQHTGKPPLLGPAASFVAWHLSPIYFYLLMPAYLLTTGHYFYPHLALTLYVGGWLAATAYLVHRAHRYQPEFWACVSLLVCSPAILNMSRYVTNPSFVWPPLVWALFAILIAPDRSPRTRRYLLLSAGAAAALAASLNLSALPVILGLGIMEWYWSRHKHDVWAYLWGVAGGGLLWQLPILAFEGRYRFQLTRRLWSVWRQLGLMAGNTAEKLAPTPLSERIVKLGSLIIGQRLWLWLAVLGGGVILFYRWYQQKKPLPRDFLAMTLGLITTLVVTLIPPVSINGMYVMAVVVLTAGWLALWPSQGKYLLITLLSVGWLRTGRGALRPITWQLDRPLVEPFAACMEQVCTALHHQPTYFALVSDQVAIHTRDSYAYGLSRAGCPAHLIATEASAASQLVVFEESQPFTPQVDHFMEVDLFGEATASARGQCAPNWGWIILQKI